MTGRLLRSSDVVVVREQIGRDPTVGFEVVARCSGGHPLVIRNDPVDASGDPFPTRYWLTCPAAVRAVSRLEADGWIARTNDRYDADLEFRTTVDAAHRAYALEREKLGGASHSGGVGGTRRGVKCLHAHYAYALVGGDDPVGLEVVSRIGAVHGSQPPRVAAIDQGTNSTRLLVVEPAAAGSDHEETEIARDMVITRLGRGVDETGRLDDAAVERTLEAIRREVRRAAALGAARLRIGLTSAVRDAANRDDFVAAVRAAAPRSHVEILSGEREAQLSFAGATRGLDPQLAPFLVVDIGGGSTELVLGAGPDDPVQAFSAQMGSVRMTERHVRHDPPTAGELVVVERDVAGLVARASEEIAFGQGRTLVLVAGTATTTQAVALGLEVHDPDLVHRSWLTHEDARRTRDRFAALTDAERAALPVMPPGRGDVITAGATILVTVMDRLGFDRGLVSETDILDELIRDPLDVR